MMDSVKTVTLIVLEGAVFKATSMVVVVVEVVEAEVVGAIVMTGTRVVIQSTGHHMVDEKMC